MMEKSAQPGVGGGARTPPSTLVTITYKVAVYASAERADTLPLPLYNFCGAANLWISYPVLFCTLQNSRSILFYYEERKGMLRSQHSIIVPELIFTLLRPLQAGL
jgi:hypothetical protein